VLGLVVVVVLTLGLLSLSNGRLPEPVPTFDPTLVAFATTLAQSTPSATNTEPPPTASSTVAPTRTATSGTLFFAARASQYSHLWAYVPGDARPIQLTAGEWDDRDPSVDPQGERIVFSSHRDGNWDLYLLTLKTGDIRRLTQTAGFEGHPVWSPDGQWVAFEGNYDGDFDIWILPIDADQSPVQLTNDPAADITPAWDSGGRRIAFISDRQGSPDVYIADLNRADDRFTNLTNSPQVAGFLPRREATCLHRARLRRRHASGAGPVRPEPTPTVAGAGARGFLVTGWADVGGRSRDAAGLVPDELHLRGHKLRADRPFGTADSA
jgi:hypothetical protein